MHSAYYPIWKNFRTPSAERIPRWLERYERTSSQHLRLVDVQKDDDMSKEATEPTWEGYCGTTTTRALVFREDIATGSLEKLFNDLSEDCTQEAIVSARCTSHPGRLSGCKDIFCLVIIVVRACFYLSYMESLPMTCIYSVFPV